MLESAGFVRSVEMYTMQVGAVSNTPKHPIGMPAVTVTHWSSPHILPDGPARSDFDVDVDRPYYMHPR
jgi:hypothetical protein